MVMTKMRFHALDLLGEVRMMNLAAAGQPAGGGHAALRVVVVLWHGRGCGVVAQRYEHLFDRPRPIVFVRRRVERVEHGRWYKWLGGCALW